MAASALSFAGVDAYYGDSHVLQGVTFAAGEGRVLGLIGRNGAGKSTCMQGVGVGATHRAQGRLKATYAKLESVSSQGAQ